FLFLMVTCFLLSPINYLIIYFIVYYFMVLNEVLM
ncbi:putative membrane protein, partial [Yersinia pestis PY-52]